MNITYASSKLWIASLIPSAPSARVPYGSLPDPDTFLSSDTRSDSSLEDHQDQLYGSLNLDGLVPQEREHPRDTPDSQNLVLDDLSALRRLC